MKFEHLVEVNNPLNPHITSLSREQLYRGLVLRAESPTLFMPQLVTCEILEKTPEKLTRRLNYGKFSIKDHVSFEANKSVSYFVPKQGEILDSTLEMLIEEPEPDHLFVRFTYQDSSSNEGVDSFYNDFKRSAYQEADIDTISMIRQLAAEGRLGS